MAAARTTMMTMICGMKTSKMGNLIRFRPFCTVTPPPPPSPIWISELRKGTGVADDGGSEIVKEEEETRKKEKEKEKEEVKVLNCFGETASRRGRPRGGTNQVLDASECEMIKQLAMFGLDEINQRQLTSLQLVKVLGAWSTLGPGRKYDITLEAADGDGGGKWNYLVSVTNLYMFLRYTKLELVQWLLLDDPYPITFFVPETYREYVINMHARLKTLRKTSRPFVICPNSSHWWQDPCTVKG